MKYEERALWLPCEGERLAAVLTRPEQPAELGVIIVVGGPQYRVGAHRQFVLLARHLAASGFATLRFDFRGMGDSGGAQRSFEDVGADLRVAIDALFAEQSGLRHVALWGLCDGASAALMYVDATGDARVAALAVVNPWVRSPTSLARTHIEHHYKRRLHDPTFWARLVTGRIRARSLAELWQAWKLSMQGRELGAGDAARGFQQRMADGWRRFAGPILLLLSGEDYTADEFRDALRDDPLWRGALGAARVTMHDLVGADHTFAVAAQRTNAQRLTADWLAGVAASRRP